ncbi:MAG: HEAT repeat domain-containing protein [Planctomycetota bacterium]
MRPDLIHTIGIAITAAVLFGCSSTSGGKTATDQDGNPVDWIGPTETVPYDPNITKDDRKTGEVLADIDRKLRLWNGIVLEGRASKDASRLDLVESSLRYEASKNIAILVEQLEVGPPTNRQIAAAGLGFSESTEALGPLMAALDDPSSEVVANALLGLSTLRDAETPVAPIAAKLGDALASIPVRSNAGRALRALNLTELEESDRDAIVDAARTALGDDDSALRVHGALVLAQVGDSDSVGRIARYLGDESQIVVRAVSRSLARLGSIDDAQFGRAVRALVAAMTGTDDDTIREAILDDLQALTKINYGDDEEEWIKYAQKLP